MENADKQIAWFPASYLEEIDVHKDIQNTFCSDNEGKSAAGSLGPHIPPSEKRDGGIFLSRQTQLLSLSAGSLYFVVRAYESQRADELSLNNGVVVEVVRKSEDGWWLIR